MQITPLKNSETWFVCEWNVAKRTEFIRECQRNVVNNNSRCLLSKAAVLFHNNARPNSAAATAQTISSTNLNPLHTPHTTPIHFHAVNTCYGPLKNPYVDENLKVMINLRTRCTRSIVQSRKFLRRWIQKACETLHTVWQNGATGGDYVER